MLIWGFYSIIKNNFFEIILMSHEIKKNMEHLNSMILMSLSEEDQSLMWSCIYTGMPFPDSLQNKLKRNVVVLKNLGSVKEHEVTIPVSENEI